MKSLEEMAEKRSTEAEYLALCARVVLVAKAHVSRDFDKTYRKELSETIQRLETFEKDHGLE